MINVYVNYPNSSICIHKDAGCNQIRKNDKDKARVSVITPDTYEKEKRKFQTKVYRLTSAPGYNGIWLEIDFGDLSKDKDILNQIQEVLRSLYTGFRNKEINEHC
jgi:uncharacterized protein (UPF0297 family)